MKDIQSMVAGGRRLPPVGTSCPGLSPAGNAPCGPYGSWDESRLPAEAVPQIQLQRAQLPAAVEPSGPFAEAQVEAVEEEILGPAIGLILVLLVVESCLE